MDVGGGTGAWDHSASTNIHSTPPADRKKLKAKKKNKSIRPTYDVSIHVLYDEKLILKIYKIMVMLDMNGKFRNSQWIAL